MEEHPMYLYDSVRWRKTTTYCLYNYLLVLSKIMYPSMQVSLDVRHVGCTAGPSCLITSPHYVYKRAYQLSPPFVSAISQVNNIMSTRASQGRCGAWVEGCPTHGHL